MTSVVVKLNPILQLTDSQFLQVCRANPDVKFERNQKGELIIVAPTGGEIGSYNSELNADFVFWNRRTQSGVIFDSSTCFRLPNGADRSPDVTWIQKERWNLLSPRQQRQFPPLAPDFVLELVSPNDSFADAQAKLREYLENGVRLGWLIDPETKQVEIYRPGQKVEVLQAPSTLSGEDVLIDFVLNLDFLWRL